MSQEIRVPEVGESVAEGLLVEWESKEGDLVDLDDPLFVLETDKATLTVNAEKKGRLKILVREGETVRVGQVVGRIEESADSAEREEASEPEGSGKESDGAPTSSASKKSEESRQLGRAKEEKSPPPGLSPSIRRMLREKDVDPDDVSGSGPGGRITRGDLERYLAENEPSEKEEASKGDVAGSERVPRPAEDERPQAVESRGGDRRESREKMTPLRQRIAQRLVEAQQTAAILTTFNEADLTSVLAWRARHRESFKEKYDVDLGLMSFFVKASVDALRTVPRVNCRIEGDEIVQNFYYDIGVAVSTDRGLVVPVVRDADRLSFAELEVQISELARRAREKTLILEEMSGGCFTISNGGVFGSLLSTPILNPPQCGILGMHAIKRRPVVVDDEIQIRPMMYLALSYDHRIIDGRESVTFLRRIVECIENPERMLLEI